jgi:hypothetical protein
MSTTITVSVCDVDCAQATNNALAATPTIACLTTVKLRDQKTTTLIPCDQIGGGSGDGGPSTSSFCVATMSTPVPGVLCKTQLSDPTCYVHAAQVSCAPATATTSSSDLSPTSTTGSSPTPNSQTPGSQFSPTSTSPTIATSKKDPKAGYVPPGAAAGIGIGAALAGAVIAALIFFFVLQRFKKRNRQPQLSAYAQHVGPYPDAARQEKSTMVAVTGGASSIDSYLPQPAADDAITGDMSRLRDKIKDHVQSYYHVSPISPQMVDPSKLQDVARAVGISPQRMQELLLNPHSRIPAIRLYLAWLILSRCGGQGQARSSFLPAEVASFAPFIAGMDKTNNGKSSALISHSLFTDTKKAKSHSQANGNPFPEHSFKADMVRNNQLRTMFWNTIFARQLQ